MAAAERTGEATLQSQVNLRHASSRILKVSMLSDEVASRVADLMQSDVQGRLLPQEASQLRELSLTLVAWDRMLYAFVISRLNHAGVSVPPAGGPLADAVQRFVLYAPHSASPT